jgi:hypothetical protein
MTPGPAAQSSFSHAPTTCYPISALIWAPACPRRRGTKLREEASNRGAAGFLPPSSPFPALASRLHPPDPLCQPPPAAAASCSPLGTAQGRFGAGGWGGPLMHGPHSRRMSLLDWRPAPARATPKPGRGGPSRRRAASRGQGAGGRLARPGASKLAEPPFGARPRHSACPSGGSPAPPRARAHTFPRLAADRPPTDRRTNFPRPTATAPSSAPGPAASLSLPYFPPPLQAVGLFSAGRGPGRRAFARELLCCGRRRSPMLLGTSAPGPLPRRLIPASANKRTSARPLVTRAR